MCIYMYIHTHRYIYTYIHMYIYIYTATGAPAQWRPTAGSLSRSQHRNRSMHCCYFEYRVTARERISLNMVLLACDGAQSGRCQCTQSDDRSSLYSTATGAPAPWLPTAWPSHGSQRHQGLLSVWTLADCERRAAALGLKRLRLLRAS